MIKTLLDHGIILGVFAKDTPVDAETYQIREIVPAKEDYVAPEKIDVDIKPGKVTARKGDLYVSVEQPAANLIPCLLEPQSEYGLIRYQAYKLVLQKGAVFPFVRVVKQAGRRAVRRVCRKEITAIAFDFEGSTNATAWPVATTGPKKSEVRSQKSEDRSRKTEDRMNLAAVWGSCTWMR